MKRLNYVFVLLLFSLMGCASTKLTSFKDPDYEQKVFKKILITANTNDLEEKFELEKRMVKAFTSSGVSAVEGNKLFLPTRDFTDEEKKEVMLKNEIDAHLVISAGEFGVKEKYVPVSETTKAEEGKIVKAYKGGYKEEEPWAEYETVLYDAASGKKAWIATSLTEGETYAGKSDIMGSFCSKTVDKLFSDKLLLKTLK